MLSWALFGHSWALLPLSWALLGSLGLSWGSLEALLAPSWALLGLSWGSPKGSRRGLKKGPQKRTLLSRFFVNFGVPFCYMFCSFLYICFDTVFCRFLAASWAPKVAQEAARRHLQAPKSAKITWFVSCFFDIASFVALMFRRAFLGPLLVPTWPLQGRFWAPKWDPERTQNGTPK